MARRFGLGPVFAVEWRMTSRRWQGYALRSLTVAPLLAAIALVWYDSPAARADARGGATIQQLSMVGKTFYETTAVLLLGLVGLAAPAATAGSICQDKARGNLTLVFATDLSDPEIVLGKLAARLMPVVGMALCAAPVMAMATLFGGIDPILLAGALLVILACAVFGCSLALTLSVWGRKTHEVLMATYLFGIVYVLAAPLRMGLQSAMPWAPWWGWLPTFWDLLRVNPVFLVIAAVNGSPPPFPRVTIATQAAFFGLGLAASAALLALATWRIRRVVLGQLGRPEGERPAALRRLFGVWRRLAPGPTLDRNPVLWRECRRRGASGWTLAVWGAYVLFCGGCSAYAIARSFAGDRSSGLGLGIWINCVQVGIGLLLFSASASTSLSEERQRGSLDVLMTTPLSTRSIVWGKWWGAFRGIGPLLILPTAVGLSLASWTGRYGGVPLLIL
ncbi:MAG: hypothetical protein K2X91_17165, partial [Thermoleophilia bacterium]|nr:hypothetical protein [Thermoleophilia bacterium]